MKKKEKNDFTMSVIKSLKPISFTYSRQSKEYEKYFSGSNLKHLLKSINKKAKTSSIFNSPFLYDQTKIDNNFININIKSSFNYITDLSSLNNFPLSMIKKRKNYEEYIKKMNLFHELFYITKEKLVDFEYRKKRGQRIKKKYELQKLNGESETTLDPGKYFPKYEIIRKRYPVAFLGEPIDEEKQNNLKLKYKINKKNDKNKNLSVSNDYNKNNNKLKEKDEENINIKKYLKVNPSATMCKSSSLNNLLNIEKVNPLNIDNKTNNKIPQLNMNKTKNIDNKMNKKTLFKVSSADNINKVKCPIVFNKMPGRDRNVVIVPYCNEVDYSPNFEITRPHVPATIFKHSFDCQKFKKYMTGKIIRSYCFTPDNYFVFEVNKNKDKDKDKNLNINYK